MKSEEIVSVIIPCYNASQTLQRCLDSLSGQTYPNIEVVFVDDCSTDCSISMVEKFSDEWSDASHVVRICRHTENRGVAAARNTGLDNATGEYVYFVDSDDVVEPEALRQMVSEMTNNSLDIVGIEWFIAFSANKRYMSQDTFSTPSEALVNMMYGVTRWNLWLFMFRRRLFVDNAITFIEGQDMGEDMMAVFKLFINAGRVALIKSPLYNYYPGKTSLTGTNDIAHNAQVTANLREVERYISEKGRTDLLEYVPFLKLNIKLPLLVTGRRDKYELWRGWFSEANDMVMRNPRMSLRLKILQHWAANNHYWLVRMYYIVVFKVVYGFIYR